MNVTNTQNAPAAKNPVKVAAGRKGGQTTAARHGSVHMSSIGYGGMLVTVERYFGGDVEEMMNAIRPAHLQTVWDARLCCNVPAGKVRN